MNAMVVATAGDAGSSGPPMAAFPPQMPRTRTIQAVMDSNERRNQEEGVGPLLVQVQPHQGDDNNDYFERGDHVYQWCSLMGIPGVFQHHGIVIHVEAIPSSADGETEQLLTIADFSNFLSLTTSTSTSTTTDNTKDASGACGEQDDNDDDDDDDGWHAVEESDMLQVQSTTTKNQPAGSLPMLSACCSGSGVPIPHRGSLGSLQFSKDGCLRVYTTVSTKAHQWHKVTYSEKSWLKTHLWKRSGTSTQTRSDPPELVLQRVQFLLSSRQASGGGVIPKYHAIYANCECLAVWCKTGIWSTLQASAMLGHAAVSQVKGTATLASIAAAQTVTVPAAGVWGWLGYTTAVPLTTVNPFLLPAICAYGAVTVGAPAVLLAVAKRKWAKTTHTLNNAMAVQSLKVL
jgi:hypothetical protein